MPEAKEAAAPFVIGGEKLGAGERQTIDLPISVLSNHTPMSLPVHVIHGKRPGPVLFVSAAIHGDEIIGVEIIRRLLTMKVFGRLRGTLLAVPIVNGFGFIQHSRYLPDRRDLNRSFPGSSQGSLAGRIAYLFLNEVVARADFGIDLHSAAVHRSNLPQIRLSPSKAETMELAAAFGAPVIMTSKIREGSLREAARSRGVDVIVYEAGEGLRFDEGAIRAGVIGILRVMRALGMIPRTRVGAAKTAPVVAKSSTWLRAPQGGILRLYRTIGESIQKNDVLGVVADPFGERESEVVAEEAGLIIGRANLPVVNEGDALLHVARIEAPKAAARSVTQLATDLGEHPLFDEDEII